MGNVGSTSSDYLYWKNKPNSFSVITSTSTVKLTDGILSGVFVSAAASTPTMKITTLTGTALVQTFTPVAATSYVLPEIYSDTGFVVTLGGAVTATIFYK